LIAVRSRLAYSRGATGNGLLPPLATSAPDRNSMVAPTMLLERHERGIHVV